MLACVRFRTPVHVKLHVCVCVRVRVCVFVRGYILAADSVLGAESCIQTAGPLHRIDSCQLSLR